MKGMSTRTAYFFKGNQYEPEMVYVPENGNRILTSKIIRPKPTPEPDPLQYKVTGWDMRMNTIRTVVDTMDQAIDLSLTLLGGSSKIRPVRRK